MIFDEYAINMLGPDQYGSHFADDVFEIFDENCCILFH